MHNAEVLLYEMVICYPSTPVLPPFSSNQFPSSLPVPPSEFTSALPYTDIIKLTITTPVNILPSETSTSVSKGLEAIFKPADVPRLELLHNCLASVQRSLGNFFSFAPAEYVAFPFAVMCHLSHSVQMLYRLSMLEEPGWDRAAVRRAADILGILHEIGERLGRVAAAAGLVHGGAADVALGYHLDIFTRAAGTMRTTSTLWAAALAQCDNPGGGGGGGAGGAGGGSAPAAAGGGGTGTSSGGGGSSGGLSDGSATLTSTSATPLGMDGVTGGGVDITDAENMQALFDFEADPWLTDLFASWEG
jgi:hypothetical protein